MSYGGKLCSLQHNNLHGEQPFWEHIRELTNGKYFLLAARSKSKTIQEEEEQTNKLMDKMKSGSNILTPNVIWEKQCQEAQQRMVIQFHLREEFHTYMLAYI